MNMIAALIASLLPATAAPLPVALPPDGPWILEGEDNMCGLLHSYGADKTRMTLGVRPWPLHGQIDILIFQRGAGDAERGIATISIDTSPEPIIGDYFSFTLKDGDRRLTTVTVDRKSIETLDSARSFSIQIGKHPPISLEQPAAAKAFAALESCQKTLLETLHVDPDANSRAATPAKPIGNKANWFTPSDYPENALRGSQQGSTRLLLTIGTSGRITACVPFGSTGSQELDKAACGTLMQRGRYTQARDHGDQPIVSYQTETIRWTIG